MRPFQTTSLPTRSNDIDLLRKDGTACESRTEKQPILVYPAPHSGGGQTGGTIAIEVDGGADALMVARQGLWFRQRDVDGF
jgi:hypothetical protein